MTVKLPDDLTLWFRNIPPAQGDETSKEEHQKSKIAPEAELFIDPLTGLVVPIPKVKKGANHPFFTAFRLINGVSQSYCLTD